MSGSGGRSARPDSAAGLCPDDSASFGTDGGFAIGPDTDVRGENEATIISGETATSMGNPFFTVTDGSDEKVGYTVIFLQEP